METQDKTPTSSALRGIGIGLLVAIVITAAFAFHERNSARQLALENERMASSLKMTQGQLEALNSKVNALSAPRTETTLTVSAQRPSAVKQAVRRRSDDPRWKKVQSQLDAQGKAIDATRQDLDTTRQDLSSARTELSGSIAKTHDELVLLQKKGERNYFEFDLDKAKGFKRNGPVGMRLKKANTKHQYADMELMVDDVNLSQKHVNLYQPVVFYAAEGGQPIELVINQISKNHIHGYVSEPKYRRSELAAMAGSNAGDTTAQQPTLGMRRKLEAPK